MKTARSLMMQPPYGLRSTYMTQNAPEAIVSTLLPECTPYQAVHGYAYEVVARHGSYLPERMRMPE